MAFYGDEKHNENMEYNHENSKKVANTSRQKQPKDIVYVTDQDLDDFGERIKNMPDLIKTRTIQQPGATSILVELGNGQIRIRHGEDGNILFRGNKVKDGTWITLFNAVKRIIKENKIK